MIGVKYRKDVGLYQIGGESGVDLGEAHVLLGDVRLNTALTTSDYVITNESVVLVDSSAGAVDVTLPTPTNGRQITIKKIDASGLIVTVRPESATDTIDGDMTKLISDQWSSITLVSFNNDWYII